MVDVLPGTVLAARAQRLDGFSYKLVQGGGQYGLDVTFAGPMDIDEKAMSVVIPFADGNRRDGVGDLLEVEGIRTDRHRVNPIVLFDHGKQVQLPVALAEDPNGNYTVQIDPVARSARAVCHFYQGAKSTGKTVIETGSQDYEHSLFCSQLFDLIAKRYIRAGSIGYQVIHAKGLAPDPARGTPQGLHLLTVLMLELSAVVLPANADTVRKMLDLTQVCGKPLSPWLVKSLTPYAVEAKAIVSSGLSQDQLSNGEKSMTKELEPETKAADKMGGHLPGDQPKPPSAKEVEEEPVPEKYGAQCMRKLYEDFTVLMQDYDEMVAMLDNEVVSLHFQEVLMKLEEVMASTEELFSEAYSELGDIGGQAGEAQGSKDMDTMDDAAVGASSSRNREPTPDEAVQGMRRGRKGFDLKALRGKWRRKAKDKYSAGARDGGGYVVLGDDGKIAAGPFDSKEEAEARARDMNRKPEGPPSDKKPKRDEDDTTDKENYFHTCDRDDSGRCKSACPQCGETECKCDMKSMCPKCGAKDCKCGMKSMCQDCGKNDCDCGTKNKGVKVAPAVAFAAGQVVGSVLARKEAVKEARKFLAEVAQTKGWGEEERMKCYHFHKLLEYAWALGGSGTKSAEDDDWKKSAKAQACKDASGFLGQLAWAKDLDDSLREKSNHWHSSLAPLEEDEEETPGPGDMDAKALREIFEEQGRQLDAVQKKLAAIARL